MNMLANLFSVAVGFVAAVLTGVVFTYYDQVVGGLSDLTGLGASELLFCSGLGVLVSISTYSFLQKLADQ